MLKPTNMTNILLIDDAKDFCALFSSMASKLGILCTTTNTLKSGIAELKNNTYDIIFLDVYIGEDNGLSHIPEILNCHSKPDIIVISGTKCSKNAEQAIKSGSWDFLTKPIPLATLDKCLTRCATHRSARNRFISESAFHRGPILGSSPKLLSAIQSLGAVARTNNNVLLLGETGTGKELFARAVHENSSRKNKNFTVIDCTNLPISLAQSILFGHEKGTFTDAKEGRDGLFKLADGGTVFLDEIADLDLEIQKALLRVLQEHTFRPLSSKKEIRSDFRLVAATNKDLLPLVQAGSFREDLFFRLKSFLITLPPLRERPEDIEILGNHYMAKICDEQGITHKKFSTDFWGTLNTHTWPGNVRELVNTVNYAISNSFDAKVLNQYHLPAELRVAQLHNTADITKNPGALGNRLSKPLPPSTADSAEPENLPSFKEMRKKIVSEMEAEYLLELVSRTKGNFKAACSIAGLSRARLYELLQKHEISYK